MNLDLSVIIPVYNEEKNLPLLCEDLFKTLNQMDGTVEVLFIDDGSTDDSFQVLQDLRSREPRIRIIKFDRNYGQHPALAAGFENARGEVIVILDADLQNDPADIPRFVEKIREGNRMVWGWRENRQDPLIARKIPSYFFNKMICQFTGVRLRDINCGIKAFHRSITQAINQYGERRSFLPVFLASISPSLAEIPVHHRPREHGKSKYHFFKSCGIIFSFLTSYSVKTFRMVGILGLFAAGGGMALGGLYTLLYYLVDLRIDKMATMLSLLIIVGVQFFIIGMIGEMINRIYRISNNQPLFVVEKIVGE